jgi:UDP-N-acetylmuramoyl-tripeptide--D-alanyl-D-alanine ligase
MTVPRPLWTGAEIAAACQGTLHGDFTAHGVTFDSREVIGGELFVAMKGETTDGHRFLPSALARGAAGALVSESCDMPHVRVADTMAALRALAAAARDRAPATRIGVTGSVGKTGTKEALAAALARFAPDTVHASVKSYNNHTGVPLSLARMPAATRFGVFEMGMNHSGELTDLSALVRPHIAMVTWVASAHREFFDSEADIARAKAEIFSGLLPGGTAIWPFDNIHHDILRKAAEAAGRAVSFGFSARADVHAEAFTLHPDYSDVTARVHGEQLHYRIGMAGRHWVSNSLAVLAAVHAASADLAQAGLALADLSDLPGRGKRLRVAAGGGEAIVIDESYNANPASMAASLAVLGDIAPRGHGRRLAVLGDMRELGTESAGFHAGLAPYVEAAGLNTLILVGNEMKALAAVLGSALHVVHVAEAGTALEVLNNLLDADDVVLIKGSNSLRLGDVVAALATRKEAS